MSAKLPIGSGMHRAKRNRSRGPRTANPATLNQVHAATRPLVLRKATVKEGGRP